MTVRKTVGSLGSLAQGAVSTAVGVAKHPIGSASLAVGFTKGLAVAGVDLLRGESQAPAEDLVDERAEETAVPAKPTLVKEPEPESEVEVEVVEDPRDELPGPDLAAFEPPTADELPEPIVITADDAAYTNGESGEAFHHEPKVASREVAHGESGTDLEQADGFTDEIPEDLEVDR
jgi:hypothetical protein